MWFRPNTRSLDIIDGHGGLNHAGGAGNDECIVTEELLPHTTYQISIRLRQKIVEVYICVSVGGVCSGPLVLRCTEKREDRVAFRYAQVFAADTFYEPAKGAIFRCFPTVLRLFCANVVVHLTRSQDRQLSHACAAPSVRKSNTTHVIPAVQISEEFQPRLGFQAKS